eukprot:6598681-Alexandrium_andersonii.AAC.1
MEQCVEVYCQQFDVVKAQLSRRKVGTPFADDVQKPFWSAVVIARDVVRSVAVETLPSCARQN